MLPDEDARERLVALEKVRAALATTQAQADEIHDRVARLLERSAADDAEADQPRDRRPKR